MIIKLYIISYIFSLTPNAIGEKEKQNENHLRHAFSLWFVFFSMKENTISYIIHFYFCKYIAFTTQLFILNLNDISFTLYHSQFSMCVSCACLQICALALCIYLHLNALTSPPFLFVSLFFIYFFLTIRLQQRAWAHEFNELAFLYCFGFANVQLE